MRHAIQSWQPIEPRRKGLLQGAAVVTLIGALAGTGGDISVERIRKYPGTGSALRTSRDSQAAQREHGLATELKLIRKALRLSVAETAQLFGVSRPTIYSWQNGNPLNLENAEQLYAIVNAITPHLPLLETQVGRVAHRAIEGRTTLLRSLAAGRNADQAMSQLVELLAREATQREQLARRLQDRGGSRGAADIDTLG